MWGTPITFTRYLLSLLYPGSTQHTLVDETCFHDVPLGVHSIGVMDYTVWDASDFEFTTPTSTCGTSFVNSGNQISCFGIVQGDICRTNFPPETRNNPPYLYIHIAGVGDDVQVRRVPRNSTHLPQFRRTFLDHVISLAGTKLDVILELEAVARCTTYPSTFLDASGSTWELIEGEQWCDDTVSALYRGQHQIGSDPKTSSNATHDFYLAKVGGLNSVCNGWRPCVSENADFTYTLPRTTPPPTMQPPRTDEIALMATLIPVAVVVATAIVTFLLRRQARAASMRVSTTN